MSTYDVRVISTSVSATDVVNLSIANSPDTNPGSDIVRNLQLANLSINSNSVISTYYGANPNDNTLRTRLINVNGVSSGYLSDNCGITIQSRTTEFGYSWDTMPLPSPMTIGAKSINPTGPSFIGLFDSALTIEIPTSSTYSVYDLLGLFDLPVSTSVIIPPTLVSEIVYETQDADFAPQIQFLANTAGLGTMTYRYKAVYGASSPWDYSITIVNGPVTYNDINYDRTMTITSLNFEEPLQFFMTSDIIFNLSPSVDVYFFGIDNEPLHVGNEDVANLLALAPFNYGGTPFSRNTSPLSLNSLSKVKK
jgi:hypothetical protein